MDSVNSLATEIAKHGVGHAVAVELGLQFSKRDELSFQRLGRAPSKRDRERVAEAVREWADGDSVAAHYGFGIDLFCSADCGKNVTGPSVLDGDHRKWLREGFGVQFVTLAELVTRVAA